MGTLDDDTWFGLFWWNMFWQEKLFGNIVIGAHVVCWCTLVVLKIHLLVGTLLVEQINLFCSPGGYYFGWAIFCHYITPLSFPALSKKRLMLLICSMHSYINRRIGKHCVPIGRIIFNMYHTVAQTDGIYSICFYNMSPSCVFCSLQQCCFISLPTLASICARGRQFGVKADS